MITSSAFAGKRYCVLGLARSGMASVEALLASGAQVTAWDRRPEACEELLGRATIADPLEIDLAGFAAIVVSPGVPLNTHPVVEKARLAGVPVIGDIELFAQARAELPPHKVVGITGTNGKSTTTALVTHLLESAGVPSLMGGNIGLPIMGQEPLPEGGVYVLELSSYQIDLTFTLDCDVAVLLNITPDHLDRYDGFDAYAASKARLFEMQSAEHVAVICPDDPTTDRILSDQMLKFHHGATPTQPATGPKVHIARGDRFETDKFFCQSDWPTLQGPHNAQNVAAAIATVAELGLAPTQIRHYLRTYPGLPHRMERIAECSKILFVNDSKATNPASTAPALSAWPANPNPRVHWICGGLPKEDNLDECLPHLGNVARAYTIGEAGPLFAELLAPHVPVENCEMMCEALQRALAHAKAGDVILLSPACASFDQFRDYEARGNAFRDLVAQMCSSSERDSAA